MDRRDESRKKRGSGRKRLKGDSEEEESGRKVGKRREKERGREIGR